MVIDVFGLPTVVFALMGCRRPVASATFRSVGHAPTGVREPLTRGLLTITLPLVASIIYSEYATMWLTHILESRSVYEPVQSFDSQFAVLCRVARMSWVPPIGLVTLHV